MRGLKKSLLQPWTVRLAAFAVYLGGLAWLGYFTPRTDFVRLGVIYACLFGIYLFVCYSKHFKSQVRLILAGALLLRLALLVMRPNLTDDYIRYIWDGLLVAGGYNPYLSLPSEIAASPTPVAPGLSAALFGELNSPDYYTAYPPAAQLLLGLCARLAGGSMFGNILVLRALTLLAEAGTIFLMYRLAARFSLPQPVVYLYAFNPLVIIELTGNLHLEAVMIFFLLLAIFLMVERKIAASAVSFALAAGIKIVPLIFLPFLIKRLGAKKSLVYFSITGVSLALLFLPFLNREAMANFFSSLGLFFRVLQFNSPVYALLRWIGYENINSVSLNLVSVLLPAICFLGIALLAVKERAGSWQTLFTVMTLGSTIFLLTSANVHPWYLTPLVMLSAFTRFRFVLAWSFMAIFTYAAYRSMPYRENLWVVLAEYLFVGGWLIYELLPKKRITVNQMEEA